GPRCDARPRRIDNCFRLRRPEIADARNPITTNCDIDTFRVVSGSIENRPASDNNVEICGTRRWISREHCEHDCHENSEAEEVPLHRADSRCVERRCRFENVCWRPKPYSRLPSRARSTNLLSWPKARRGDRGPCSSRAAVRATHASWFDRARPNGRDMSMERNFRRHIRFGLRYQG